MDTNRQEYMNNHAKHNSEFQAVNLHLQKLQQFYDGFRKNMAGQDYKIQDCLNRCEDDYQKMIDNFDTWHKDIGQKIDDHNLTIEQLQKDVESQRKRDIKIDRKIDDRLKITVDDLMKKVF